MIRDLTFLIGGLVLLFFGGESLVRGSVAIANRFGISRLVVGLVIVGFGTSAPELLVSIQAAMAGSPDIAIGNVVGSNIANILLIIGVAALIAPVGNADTAIRRDAAIMLAVSLGLVGILLTGQVSRLAGIAMLVLLGLYLGVTYVLERKRQASAFVHEAEEVEDIPLTALVAAGAVVLGLAFLVFGASLLVDGASGIARDFGVSEAIIGLTVVAFGTSLPELATAVVAAIRRHSDVMLANVIGSSIFNILGVLGVTATIGAIPVAGRFGTADGPIMAAVAFATVVMLFTMKAFGRTVGIVLLASYLGYIFLQGALG